MKYGVTLIHSAEGWAVWCDTLPGCCSQGSTREEALDNIRIAISEYLEAQNEMLESGEGVLSVEREEVFV